MTTKERQMKQRAYLALNKLITSECPNYRACLSEFSKCKQIMNLQELEPFKLTCKVFRDALMHYETISPTYAYVAQLRRELEACQPEPQEKPKCQRTKASPPPSTAPTGERTCKQCGQPFTPTGNAQKYCRTCRPPRTKAS